MRSCLVVAVTCTLAGLVSAQPPVEAWVARYNGPDNGWDEATDMAVDGYGYVYVTGRSWDDGTGFDYLTVKYDPLGGEEWTARYDGPAGADDIAYSVGLDGSGNVYVTGYATGIGTDNRDIATVKYSQTGAEQWVAVYDGPGHYLDCGWSIAVDAAGHSFVTGHSAADSTPGYGSLDCVTIMYDADGGEQWVERYAGPGGDVDMGRVIVIDGNGDLRVACISTGGGTDWDICTLAYSDSGEEQWAARYDGPGSGTDWATDIAVDASDNVIVTGYGPGSAGGDDYVTIKYDSDGNEQWVARYAGPYGSNDFSYGVAVDGAGSVYVTGGCMTNTSIWDYGTVKYSPSGGEQWVAHYNGPGNHDDVAMDIVVDGSGNAYVTGYSYGGNDNGEDYATLCYSAAGSEMWVLRYRGPGDNNDYGRTIALDEAGNVYVSGYSTGLNTGMFDYATIRYGDETGVEGGVSPASLLLSAGPNPASGYATVEIALPGASECVVAVYRTDGRLVEVLQEGLLAGGMHSLSWQAGGCPAGVYLVRAVAGRSSATARVVLLR